MTTGYSNIPQSDESSSSHRVFHFPHKDHDIKLEIARRTWEKPLAAIDSSHNDWHVLRRKKINSPKTTRNRTTLTAAMFGFAASQAALDHLSEIQTFKPSVYLPVAAAGVINLVHAQFKSIGVWSARKNLTEENHRKVHHALNMLRDQKGEADFIYSGFIIMFDEAIAPLLNPGRRFDTSQRASDLVEQFEEFLNYSYDISEKDFAATTQGYDFIAKSLSETLRALRYDCDEISKLSSPTKCQSEFRTRAQELIPALNKIYGLACRQRNLFENATRGVTSIQRIPICRELPDV